MRAYFWGNFYLSSIQQGIQALHTLGNMFVKYDQIDSGGKQSMIYEWADKHKTVVVMNGGDSADLHEIAHIVAGQNRYPWATFTEEGITDALTCVGLVVDEKMVDYVNEVRSARREKRRFDFGERLDTETYELVMLIANGLLAR